MPASHETVEQTAALREAGRRTVFKFAVQMTEEISRRMLEQRLHDGRLDLFVSHQANRRIIEAATTARPDPEKVVINLDKYGNTTAGTIPLALADAPRRTALKHGDLVCSRRWGAGFTVESVLPARWSL
jgi:3-oxoacyl-[acyl-carrier-protein] synthase-3